jgi:hypothetical protein
MPRQEDAKKEKIFPELRNICIVTEDSYKTLKYLGRQKQSPS